MKDLVAIGFLRMEVASLKHEASGRVAKTAPNVKGGVVIPFRIPWMANAVRTTAPADSMIALAGGTFLMGSDRRYPEEAPAHCVSVSPFRIDATPVTNAQFPAFVTATGHVTQAEIAPKAEDYPGARPEMLRAGSLTFRPPAGRISLSQPLSW